MGCKFGEVHLLSSCKDFTNFYYYRKGGLRGMASQQKQAILGPLSVSLLMGGDVWAKKLLNASEWCMEESSMEELVEAAGFGEDKNLRMERSPRSDSKPSNSCQSPYRKYGRLPYVFEWCKGYQTYIFLCDQAKEVRRVLGIWDTIAHLLVVDRSGSVVLEEVIRKEEQVRSMDVGLTELILTGPGAGISGRNAGSMSMTRLFGD
jgi:hypothetical protein